jgi:hypothetical protein
MSNHREMFAQFESARRSLHSLERDLIEMEISTIASLDLVIVNPAWKDNAHDLIRLHKTDDQHVTSGKVKFQVEQSINLEELLKCDIDLVQFEPRYSMHLINNDQIIPLTLKHDVKGNPYICQQYTHDGKKIGVFFFDVNDCMDNRDVQISDKLLNKHYHRDIEVLVVQR